MRFCTSLYLFGLFVNVEMARKDRRKKKNSFALHCIFCLNRLLKPIHNGQVRFEVLKYVCMAILSICCFSITMTITEEMQALTSAWPVKGHAAKRLNIPVLYGLHYLGLHIRAFYSAAALRSAVMYVKLCRAEQGTV